MELLLLLGGSWVLAGIFAAGLTRRQWEPRGWWSWLCYALLGPVSLALCLLLKDWSDKDHGPLS